MRCIFKIREHLKEPFHYQYFAKQQKYPRIFSVLIVNFNNKEVLKKEWELL